MHGFFRYLLHKMVRRSIFSVNPMYYVNPMYVKAMHHCNIFQWDVPAFEQVG